MYAGAGHQNQLLCLVESKEYLLILFHLVAHRLTGFLQVCVRSSFRSGFFVKVTKCWPAARARGADSNRVLPQIDVSETVFDFILKVYEYESTTCMLARLVDT